MVFCIITISVHDVMELTSPDYAYGITQFMSRQEYWCR